jgi:predicted HTH domain antitoxin
VASPEVHVEQNIAVLFPKPLAVSLKMQDREFEREMKKVCMIKLYEMGKVSSGTAAKILNIPRVFFLDLLADYNVSVFADADELEDDFAAVKSRL